MHSGASVLHFLTRRRDFRQLNVLLTRAVLRTCGRTSLTNEILFNTLICRFLAKLRARGFTDEELLRLAQHANVIFPWSLEYDALRFNANKLPNYFPLLIFYPEEVAQVQFALATAKKHEMTLTVRSGGHNNAGYSVSGEAVVDLSLLRVERNRSVVIAQAGLAAVSPGVPLGILVTRLAEVGRATPTGTCPGVGAGGLLLGGGIGYLGRKYGLSCDNIVSVDLMLTDGREVVASREKRPDLFRCMLGAGGGNYGIVTRMTVRTFPVTRVVRFDFTWTALDAASKALLTWQRFVDNAPRSISGTGFEQRLGTDESTLDGVCPALPGESDQALLARFERILAKYWPDMPAPDKRLVRVVSYVEAAEISSGSQPQAQPFVRARNAFVVQPLGLRDWRRILRFVRTKQPFQNADNGISRLILDGFGRRSYINRVPEDATVFPTRKALFWMLNYTFWASPELEREAVRFSDEFNALWQPIVSPWQYYNWQDHNRGTADHRYLRTFFSEQHLALLKSVKQRYDPTHFFSFPFGISQAPEPQAANNLLQPKA